MNHKTKQNKTEQKQATKKTLKLKNYSVKLSYTSTKGNAFIHKK